jgi:hypothetical protein
LVKNSVVVMPACKRPEFLALALEKLDKAADAPEDVRIFLDTSPESRVMEVEWVRDKYLPRAQIFHAPPHIEAPSGTWNILNAIRQGYETGAELIYLIEEDVMIRPETFFPWHRSIHDAGAHDGTVLATCGRVEKRLERLFGEQYTNPGSALTRALIRELIPHMNDSYFSNPADYVLAEFEPWIGMSILDDGLIRRVIKKAGGKSLTATEGVAVHQGFFYYNRLDRYMNHEPTIWGKIARLREIIAGIVPGERYATDFEPYV